MLCRVESLPHPWNSELKSKGVAQWLHASPDFDLLMGMAMYGADLCYSKTLDNWPRGQFKNAVSQEHSHEISRQIEAEQLKGWMVEVPESISTRLKFANAPLIAVDEVTKIRRITDFSNRDGAMVQGMNSMVNLEKLGKAPMQRPKDLGKAVYRLQKRFPGQPLGILVRDLSKAFRKLSVRLSQVPSLSTRWKGRHYWDLRLPFGHSASAHYCCKLTSAMASSLTDYFSGRVECLAYVDDFALIAPIHLQVQALHVFEKMVDDLGLTISTSKAAASGSWSTTADWIGFTHDVSSCKHYLPSAKLVQYTGDLSEAIKIATKGSSIPRRDLLQLVGRINHVATIFTAGRAFMRSLLGATMVRKARVPLNQSHLADLIWWQKALATLPKFASMRRAPVSTDPLIATDASLRGFGAILEMSGSPGALAEPLSSSKLLAGSFLEPSSSGDMTLLEMWAVLMALKEWAPAIVGCSVQLHVDNVSVEFALKKGRSFSPRVNAVLRDVLLLCLQNDICLYPVHVQSKDNIVADGLSRLTTKQLLGGHLGSFPISRRVSLKSPHNLPSPDQQHLL